jgi:hypothetical protein
MRFVLDVEREWVGEDGQGSIQSSPAPTAKNRSQDLDYWC